ncbi:MAG: hypothetical protein ACI3T9_00935 [Romboutsia timonensis]
MKKKRRRLKSWVKVTLAVLVLGGLFGILLNIASDRYNSMYEQCDNAKGYTCSYYEARLYSIRGE